MASGLFIGEHVAAKVAIRPVAQAAATVNGLAIARGDAPSCVLLHATGSETGAPSARTVASKLQDSSDGSTGWVDIPGAAVGDLTAINTEARAAISLLGSTKDFIRVVTTVSFTGGTAPTIVIAATLVLGGQRTRPAA